MMIGSEPPVLGAKGGGRAIRGDDFFDGSEMREFRAIQGPFISRLNQVEQLCFRELGCGIEPVTLLEM